MGETLKKGIEFLEISKFRTSLRWFSRRDQNAWDLRKFCAYKRDNAV